MLGYKNSAPVKLRTDFNAASVNVTAAAGKACPDYVFANDNDYAYGLFLPDERSLKSIIANISYEKDLFTRTLLWGALFDSMHFADLDPRDYIDAALGELPSEQDELLIRSISTRTINALHDYLADTGRNASFESLAFQRMKNAPSQGERILWFRAFVTSAQGPNSLYEVKKLLRGTDTINGVEFRSLDRWRMLTVLLAQSDPEAISLFEAEKERDSTGAGQKYAYVAVAARPGAANKTFYFNDYLHNSARPEDWVQDSLVSFNQWNQTNVTFSYLRPALDALPRVKQQRKIFFLVAWLTAFVGGQVSNEASHEVHSWLDATPVDPDLKLKVLQVLDDLDRTVKIRSRFMTSPRLAHH